MRRILRQVPVVALACVSYAALAVPASAQVPKPDLVVSSAAEPPDFVPLDGDFLASFTVDNQGRGRARQVSLARAYLSVGRVLSADDRRRRVGQRRVRALSPGRSTTRRMVIEIPPAFRQGDYFLIVCADVRNVIDETNDRANCHVSGQRLRVAADDTRGAPGPPGPAGPAGPPGSSDSVKIPRKTLALGTATIDGPEAEPGDNEGSTQQFDLLEVGGVRIRALCRQTTNGNGDLPNHDADNDGVPDGGGNDFDFRNPDGDGDEAKILLYLDRPDGNFSFSGRHGRRMNVNAGFGNTTTSIEDPDDDTGGEGKHMAIATSQDPEVRVAGDADDTDPSIGEDQGPDASGNANAQDKRFEPEDDWVNAFQSGSVYVATSSGAEFILNAYAGIGVLGAANDQCVFGGSVTVVNR
ncbi:MAG TPA: CARDB domain-containing protein [Solirubrobacteraceae bacterium]|nr:CARDB domain-containing protein [Solirubrobacteraceae bacterium]